MYCCQSSARGFLGGVSDKPKTEGGKRVYFTSYNPVHGQTDSSPCVGASGQDQCSLAKKGERIIALSQDLVGRAEWKAFHYGDRVLLQGEIDDPRCNGEFTVLDTMNKRFRNRGDIFMPNRADNIDCWATVTKISP